MSDVSLHSEPAQSAFSARVMLLVTAVGAIAFMAMLVLGAYAPDLRSGRNGGAHALSNAATGYSGLVALAKATGRNPRVVRIVQDLDNEDLAVVTPDNGSTNLGNILNARGPRTTLIVLPKWMTQSDAAKPGWVRVQDLVYPANPEAVLSPDVKIKVARSKGHGEPLRNVGLAQGAPMKFLAPAIVQSIAGKDLEPLIVTAEGRIVLAQVRGRQIYLLSEPDLLNNHGMGDERQARAALELLDFLNSTGATSILFDVTANGLGRSRSPLKLAFDPPFLAVTLTILAAMLLAAWQALARFGPVRRRERAIAFGKTALVDNSAALIRKAGREASFGTRYADLVRDRAISLFRLPAAADPATLNARLQALNPDRSFDATSARAREAHNRGELLGAAQSLNRWLEEAQGESR